MKYEVNLGDKALSIDIKIAGDKLVIDSALGQMRLDAVKIQRGVYSVLLDNQSFVVGVCSENDQRVNVNGAPLSIKLLDAIHLHLRDLGWESVEETKLGQVATQIPGLITKIFYQVGDEVEEGEPLLLMEAMKMENEIKAPVSGTILKINVQAGQTVDKGTNIIEIG